MKKKLTKVLCMALVAALMLACFAGCGGNSGSGTIKIGLLGPHTGDYAVYGLAVRNGAQLYFDKVNAAGGINGKQIETVVYDHKGDSTEAVTAFNRMVDQDGITALLGDVLSGNTIVVVGEASPVNMPVITPSATAQAVTVNETTGEVYSNVFRTCFIDPFQGEKMASYAAEKLGVKTAAVIYETGNDYAVGLKDAFKATCGEKGVEIVGEEGYATGDVDFKAQLTNIMAANPDVVFCPNYYQDDGLIITQARELGLTSTFLGGDGWDGVCDYASAEDLEGCYFCSGYAAGSADVAEFEAAYTAAYGTDTLNMFAATAYDAAMLLCAALEKAEATGSEPGSDEYKQAIIDAIPEVGSGIAGVTSKTGYTFDENHNPIKQASIMTVTGGVQTFVENY